MTSSQFYVRIPSERVNEMEQRLAKLENLVKVGTQRIGKYGI